jgi:N-acetylglutamate synthase-like GNAT family acetyltransferase
LTLSIRPAADIDKPAIRTLLAMHKLPLDGLFSGDSQYFVALDNGMFVGCAGFEYYQPDALLRSVAIAPDYQHYGAGSQLVDFMIGHAKKRNTEQIFRTKRFYLR